MVGKNDMTTTLIVLLKRFMAMAEERAKTLPYRINLIETLGGACETENSKILAAFFRYRTPSGHFEILDSFIDNFRSRLGGRFESNVDQPSISTEHRHIDIYVREAHKYAIIIENKSNGADDQDAQLSRYIEIAISEGFSESQIYVLYLPPLNEKDPEDQSLGRFKEAFQERYVKLSWRDDLLPWMREKVLSNVRHRDVPLSSALEQYIDYWEGQFGLRAVNNEVKMKLRDVVIEGLHLNFQQDPGRALEMVCDAIQNAQALSETLGNLANEAKCKFEMRFWDRLIEDLKCLGHNCVDRINLTEDGVLKNYQVDCGTKWNYVGIRIRFQANGRPFVFECWAQVLGYYGFRFMEESGKDEEIVRPSELNVESQRIEQIVKELLPGCGQWQLWYGCVSTSELDFRNMGYKTVVEKLGTPDKCKTFAQQWAARFDGYISAFQKHLSGTQDWKQPKEPQP